MIERIFLDNLHHDPVLVFIDRIIQKAIKQHVSDIHLEARENNYRIRFRCNGLLHNVETISTLFATQVIASLKIMAHLDISEKRMPQDGRIHLVNHKELNVRISTCPSLFGEKVALRLLNDHYQYLDLASLGLLDEQKQLVIEKLSEPQGLIILTGPTGSGKTSTLYAALNYLNKVDKNIITIEDPVEIKLDGITQINVNTKIKLTFSELLRGIMRQDPDIIMIGEIRDKETAEIAIQAAQTGHLVLSTLHCENATDSLTRLEMLDIPPTYLENALSMIISQRLIRILCQFCLGEPPPLSPCLYCQDGYASRSGIFEISTYHNTYLSTQLTLKEAGLIKIQQGFTHFDELKRVLRL